MDSYKAVFFDFDYTLADATDGIVESFQYALSNLGFPPAEREAIRKTIGLPLGESFFRVTGDGSAAQADRFRALFKEKADEVMTQNTLLFPDTFETLDTLKKAGLKTAIVTTKYHYRIDETIRKYRLEKMIDLIVGGEDVKKAKPDPEGILLAAQRLELAAGEILFVGDSESDAGAAMNAKVGFAGVLTGTTSEQALQSYPHRVILHHLAELPVFIEAHSQN